MRQLLRQLGVPVGYLLRPSLQLACALRQGGGAVAQLPQAALKLGQLLGELRVAVGYLLRPSLQLACAARQGRGAV